MVNKTWPGRGGRWRRRALALSAALVVAIGLGAVPGGNAYADQAGKGGDFVPLPAPDKLLDTRSGLGAPAGLRGPGSTTSFPVLGRAGVPSSGVSAVLVDITGVNPSSGTWMTIWPQDDTRPSLSMINVTAKTTLSNTAVVPVGASGNLSVYNSAGSTHIVVDVHGYFRSLPSGSTGQGGFVPVTHTRLVDTRYGTGAPKATIAAGGSLTVTIGNGAPVPVTANAAFLNFTVPGASAGGYLVARQAGASYTTSTFDYLPGTTAEATAVKLDSTGRITVTNKGSAAINLIIDAHGYFSAQPTEGAGLRTVPANRVLDTRRVGTSIPANGTLDVAVGGTNGLPTRGIAGAVLNLTVPAATSGGYLTAYPTGEVEPSISHMNFPAGESRAGIVAVRPGVDGKVSIHNHSANPIDLTVDLQGWFANPLPNVPVRQYSRTSAIQAAPVGSALVGPLEYAYVNNIGQLLHGHQPDPANFGYVEWTVISEGEAFTGQPGLAEQADGRLHVASQYTDGGDEWSRSQTAQGATAWSPWQDNGGSMASPPAVAEMSDGRLVQFAVDADGKLWHLPQSAVNGAYSYWRPLVDLDLVGTPSVAVGRYGLDLFVVDGGGAVKTATYYTDGSLSAWTDLGGSGLNGTPAVVVYPGYQFRVFMRDANGLIVTKAQDSTGAYGAVWEPVGDFVAAGSPAATLSPQTGRTEVLARGADGGVYGNRETAQGSGVWGTWSTVVDPYQNIATDPTILTYNDGSGSTWLFVVRNADNQHYAYYVANTYAATTSAQMPLATARKLPDPPA